MSHQFGGNQYILGIFCSFAFFNQHILLDSFFVLFVNILKKVNFADFTPLPTCFVASSWLCDGWYHCPDNSDEEMCDCPSDRPFECDCYQSDDGCAGKWGCMEQSVVCDGRYECPDKSDEEMCDCPSHRPFECDCYQSDDGCAGGWGCIYQSFACNGIYNCPDKSDEEMCDCPSHRPFECDCYQSDDGCAGWLMWGCVEQSRVCDGWDNCGDWSDEKYCLNTKLYCRNDECVERSKVNDGKVNMTGGYDEFVCCATQGHKCGCIPGNENCTSSGKCIPNVWIGDARDDCNKSHSDEPCKAIEVWCENCQVIINRCKTNEDKKFLLQNSNKNTTTCHVNNPSFHHLNLSTKWICISSLCGKYLGEIFQCENGHVIDNAHYCDTKVQCEDGSDEQQQSFGFRCSGKSRKSTCVLPQNNLYDSTSQCADGSDICFAHGEFRCFLCLDEKLITSAKQVCDQNIDCFDGSDELLCSNQSVAQALVGDDGSKCPSGHMHCNSSTECEAMNKVLCNFSVECKDEINQRFCRHEQRSSGFMQCRARLATNDYYITVRATRCDNRPECHRMEDECGSQCDPRPSFCDDECGKESRVWNSGNRVCDGYLNRVIGGSDKCSQEVEENCSMRFPCKSKDRVSIEKRDYCDGIFHCDDQSDETSTDCLKKRFNCTAAGGAISISKEFVCDGIKDCNQGEDESRQMCGEKRFYCESGKAISIDKKFVQNGIKDCDTGLDECKTLFSDRYEMIASPFLRSLFWIMGFVALTGNLATNFLTVKEMFFNRKNNSITNPDTKFVKRTNNFFIFNLTLFDCLMGVYLLGIVGKSVSYSGHYCFVDKEWRSSNGCSILGTVAVLSSEASTFIMASMSTFRVVSIYKPFLTRTLKFKWIVLVGASCWLFPLIFAFLPWIPLKSGYFVSEVWFPNHFFKTDTVSKHHLTTIANQVSDTNFTLQSWFKVKETISCKFRYNQIKTEFGFFSQTSVCMPRFYASTSESSWEYSSILITLNFMLFIYMVVIYVLAYKKVSSMSVSTSTKKDPNRGMQKRISRLLLTDFFCWIPVCIMAYLRVSGVLLPPDAYIVSAGFLLPINSAMNPLIYSKLVGEYMSRVPKWVIKNPPSICKRHVDEATKVEGTAEQIELEVVHSNKR